jgi:quercetin dioxygenase-like cupin family protein
MELSERWLQKFEDEGFASVYEWQDPAGTVYEEHAHKGKVSLFVTDGSITFDFAGEKKEVKANERFDVPVDAPHSAIVGPQGWIVIVAEEIVGDSL